MSMIALTNVTIMRRMLRSSKIMKDQIHTVFSLLDHWSPWDHASFSLWVVMTKGEEINVE
jgi:hypothetical protein